MKKDQVRNRYVADGVQHASGGQLVSLLYERAIRDLKEADQAIMAGNNDKVNTCLCHSQDIIIELRAALDIKMWPAGKSLISLYDYLVDRMVQANIRKDRSIITECLRVLEPLGEAWRDAAQQLVDSPAGEDSAVAGAGAA